MMDWIIHSNVRDQREKEKAETTRGAEPGQWEGGLAIKEIGEMTVRWAAI